jgi:hypothetical protein
MRQVCGPFGLSKQEKVVEQRNIFLRNKENKGQIVTNFGFCVTGVSSSQRDAQFNAAADPGPGAALRGSGKSIRRNVFIQAR